MVIKLLYVALVVSVVALLVVVAAGYLRVRRHLQRAHPPETPPAGEQERE